MSVTARLAQHGVGNVHIQRPSAPVECVALQPTQRLHDHEHRLIPATLGGTVLGCLNLASGPRLDVLKVCACDGVSWRVLLCVRDRKSTRLNSSHVAISYAVFCLKKKTIIQDSSILSTRSQ